MSAHTPGPWTADWTESGVTTVRGPDGTPVALVSMAAGHANARLIKAAPRLLACLKEAVASWELKDMDESDDSAAGEAMAEWKAAIAEAEDPS